MAKIYTRTGDSGETGLFGGPRVRKDQLRVEAIGAVDELNAVLGAARAVLAYSPVTASASIKEMLRIARMDLFRRRRVLKELDAILGQAQHQLFDLGAELATPEPRAHGTDRVSDAHVAALEAAIDRFDAQLPPLREFILPGGSPAAAQLHLARCVCRRAERRLVALAAQEPLRGETLRYVNRLSDLLFVLARTANQAAGMADVTWQQEPH